MHKAKQKEKYTIETADYAEAMEFLDDHCNLLEDAGFSISGMSFIQYKDADEDTGELFTMHEAYVEGTREFKKDS